ncbi:glycogenin-2 [Gouania willdenowi]|uniref:glycogenin-2 n=1 Tax=Gouania willdenowi TaxID=441366 RepID=UPI001055D855|nr:glycogenin-2 [Gouania willdenowi]
MSAGEAFVTLATTESYCIGAKVVGKSLRRHGTTRDIVILVTPNISQRTRLALQSIFDKVILVDLMDSKDPDHLALTGRPELGITFTKIRCWTLTQYSKCVFLDADTLVLCNVDELFERDELSAASDPGWPDCFNSGVFVFNPSLQTHAMLMDHAIKQGSFDGGDQGLLNSFFSNWSVEDIRKHLPFIYNLTVSSVYTYLPAFKHFGHEAKIVHFLGAVKPWNLPKEGSGSNAMDQFVPQWWREYQGYSASEGHPTPGIQLNDGADKPPQIQEDKPAKASFREKADDANQPQEKLPETHKEEESAQRTTLPVDSKETLNGPNKETLHQPTAEQLEAEKEQMEHRRRWEMGEMDYMGRDAFQNIQKMLDRFLD